MARQRNDYENSWFPRLKRWLAGGSSLLSDRMVQGLEQPSDAHRVIPEAEIARHEEELIQHRMEVDRHEAVLYERAHNWSRNKGSKLFRALYGLISVALCVSIIAVLLVTVSNLPSFGGKDNPINNEVSQRYIERGLQETGAVNIVAGMILDYRAFDTLGESHVLFIAACAVMILLRLPEEADSRERLLAEADDRAYEPKHDIILQRVTGMLVPIILLFGVYVLFNGHLGPGGGFSGGAVIGAGLILYLNAYGFAATERFFTIRTFRAVSFCALAFYALAKAYSFFCGANHLDSGIGLGTPGAIFSSGLILYLNIAVGMVVACTMYAFYTLFRKGDM